MTIKASLKLERGFGIIFDFITPRDPISRYGTKRPTKYTMLRRNKDEGERVARTRARTGEPPCFFLPLDEKTYWAVTREQKLCEEKILRIKHTI